MVKNPLNMIETVRYTFLKALKIQSITSVMAGDEFEIYFSQMRKGRVKKHKIQVFHLFNEMGKIGKASLEHSKIPVFNIFVNKEKFRGTTQDQRKNPNFESIDVSLVTI